MDHEARETMGETKATFTAFCDARRIAVGALEEVAAKVATLAPEQTALVFCDRTGRVIDLDLRGDDAAIRKKARNHPMSGVAEAPTEPVRRKRGRPSLGVVPREVTLLPRHWEWLDAQNGSASAVLRRLIDEARRQDGGSAEANQARDAAHRALSALAGDLPGFEEAMRALFAGDAAGFTQSTQWWPEDVRQYAEMFAARAFG